MPPLTRSPPKIAKTISLSPIITLHIYTGKEKEVLAMERGGNQRVNAIFEAKWIEEDVKPHPNSDGVFRHQFIKEKLVDRHYYDPHAYTMKFLPIEPRRKPSVPLISSACPPEQRRVKRQISLPTIGSPRLVNDGRMVQQSLQNQNQNQNQNQQEGNNKDSASGSFEALPEVFKSNYFNESSEWEELWEQQTLNSKMDELSISWHPKSPVKEILPKRQSLTSSLDENHSKSEVETSTEMKPLAKRLSSKPKAVPIQIQSRPSKSKEADPLGSSTWHHPKRDVKVQPPTNQRKQTLDDRESSSNNTAAITTKRDKSTNADLVEESKVTLADQPLPKPLLKARSSLGDSMSSLDMKSVSTPGIVKSTSKFTRNHDSKKPRSSSRGRRRLDRSISVPALHSPQFEDGPGTNGDNNDLVSVVEKRELVKKLKSCLTLDDGQDCGEKLSKILETLEHTHDAKIRLPKAVVESRRGSEPRRMLKREKSDEPIIPKACSPNLRSRSRNRKKSEDRKTPSPPRSRSKDARRSSDPKKVPIKEESASVEPSKQRRGRSADAKAIRKNSHDKSADAMVRSSSQKRRSRRVSDVPEARLELERAMSVSNLLSSHSRNTVHGDGLGANAKPVRRMLKKADPSDPLPARSSSHSEPQCILKKLELFMNDNATLPTSSLSHNSSLPTATQSFLDESSAFSFFDGLESVVQAIDSPEKQTPLVRKAQCV